MIDCIEKNIAFIHEAHKKELFFNICVHFLYIMGFYFED